MNLQVLSHPLRLGCLLAAACLSGSAIVAPLDAAARDNPLVEAAKRADADAVRTLLNGGADPNAPEADGSTALHWAARVDNVELADLLLAGGADVSASNTFGVPPLWLAAINGSGPMLDRLLAAGADPDTASAAGESVLMIAARTGRIAAIEALLARGADLEATQGGGQTPLMWAATEGHTEAVQLLLDAGADIHARTLVPDSPQRSGLYGGPAPHGFTALLFAIRAGRIDTVQTLLAAGADPNDRLPDGTGPVVLAAANAHWELGVFLADQGADPNGAEQGWTALHEMTWVRRPNFGFNPPGPVTTGNLDSLNFVRELVARGADVNARITVEPRNGYRNALNRVGATPLMMAARLADAPLMRVLLELGADPDMANEDDSTLLMVAAGLGIHSPGEDPGTETEALECVQLALELGGDVNAIDANNETALHGAAYRGANSIVELLVEHGADTFDVENARGWTPLRIAQGIFRTETYKEAPHTAALLTDLMARITSRTLPDEPALGPGDVR
ncbi:MAG: ankyrin repeat domain-containing protein [Acidobacteria bacterium]|nr:ankyrin repeat domain-containing protein [Acidobacteriota bacterium]